MIDESSPIIVVIITQQSKMNATEYFEEMGFKIIHEDDFQKLVNKEVDRGKFVYTLALGSEDTAVYVMWLDDIKERYADKGDIIEYIAITNRITEWIEKQD